MAFQKHGTVETDEMKMGKEDEPLKN